MRPWVSWLVTLAGGVAVVVAFYAVLPSDVRDGIGAIISDPLNQPSFHRLDNRWPKCAEGPTSALWGRRVRKGMPGSRARKALRVQRASERRAGPQGQPGPKGDTGAQGLRVNRGRKARRASAERQGQEEPRGQGRGGAKGRGRTSWSQR